MKKMIFFTTLFSNVVFCNLIPDDFNKIDANNYAVNTNEIGGTVNNISHYDYIKRKISEFRDAVRFSFENDLDFTQCEKKLIDIFMKIVITNLSDDNKQKCVDNVLSILSDNIKLHIDKCEILLYDMCALLGSELRPYSRDCMVDYIFESIRSNIQYLMDSADAINKLDEIKRKCYDVKDNTSDIRKSIYCLRNSISNTPDDMQVFAKNYSQFLDFVTMVYKAPVSTCIKMYYFNEFLNILKTNKNIECFAVAELFSNIGDISQDDFSEFFNAICTSYGIDQKLDWRVLGSTKIFERVKQINYKKACCMLNISRIRDVKKKLTILKDKLTQRGQWFEIVMRDSRKNELSEYRDLLLSLFDSMNNISEYSGRKCFCDCVDMLMSNIYDNNVLNLIEDVVKLDILVSSKIVKKFCHALSEVYKPNRNCNVRNYITGTFMNVLLSPNAADTSFLANIFSWICCRNNEIPENRGAMYWFIYYCVINTEQIYNIQLFKEQLLRAYNLYEFSCFSNNSLKLQDFFNDLRDVLSADVDLYSDIKDINIHTIKSEIKNFLEYATNQPIVSQNISNHTIEQSGNNRPVAQSGNNTLSNKKDALANSGVEKKTIEKKLPSTDHAAAINTLLESLSRNLRPYGDSTKRDILTDNAKDIISHLHVIADEKKQEYFDKFILIIKKSMYRGVGYYNLVNDFVNVFWKSFKDKGIGEYIFNSVCNVHNINSDSEKGKILGIFARYVVNSDATSVRKNYILFLNRLGKFYGHGFVYWWINDIICNSKTKNKKIQQMQDLLDKIYDYYKGNDDFNENDFWNDLDNILLEDIDFKADIRMYVFNEIRAFLKDYNRNVESDDSVITLSDEYVSTSTNKNSTGEEDTESGSTVEDVVNTLVSLKRGHISPDNESASGKRRAL